MKFVVIEQAEDNEAYITRIKSEKEVDEFPQFGGEFIVLSERAFGNMCASYCMGK